ncbi:MAG: arylesterase [Pseudomonadota bacterium]
MATDFKSRKYRQVRVGLVASGLLALGIQSVSADTIRGVGFGDSLMAGFQLPNGAGFPGQLQTALRERGYDIEIMNAGVSGDTTSGGRERLDWSVGDDTDFVILELGGNDALRGISPEITSENLEAMIVRLQERKIDVLLAGIVAPPNMGEAYAEAFNPIFAELAAEYEVPLYPFFLEGAITNPELMMGDGIHPTAEGVEVMVENFLPFMTEYLDSLPAS